MGVACLDWRMRGSDALNCGREDFRQGFGARVEVAGQSLISPSWSVATGRVGAPVGGRVALSRLASLWRTDRHHGQVRPRRLRALSGTESGRGRVSWSARASRQMLYDNALSAAALSRAYVTDFRSATSEITLKSTENGEMYWKVLTSEGVCALEEWLARRGRGHGTILCHLDEHGGRILGKRLRHHHRGGTAAAWYPAKTK